jgi:DNA-3-methyladenine glycosylase
MEDEACHARFGKTERNAPMFGKPWQWYVYLCYGMYRMLNIVTGPGTHPSAILIRGAEWITDNGKRTPRTVNRLPLSVKLNWPGKLTKHLWITKIYNGKPANKKTGLWIEDRWVMITKVTQKPRVGIDYAGKWAKKKRRFVIKQ